MLYLWLITHKTELRNKTLDQLSYHFFGESLLCSSYLLLPYILTRIKLINNYNYVSNMGKWYLI